MSESTDRTGFIISLVQVVICWYVLCGIPLAFKGLNAECLGDNVLVSVFISAALSHFSLTCHFLSTSFDLPKGKTSGLVRRIGLQPFIP